MGLPEERRKLPSLSLSQSERNWIMEGFLAETSKNRKEQ
jgi:hypothetical protein